ncbi:MAG: rhomboid family intramembrane serine protease [Planctomycetota bacterium]|nr:MAG: rhomboid family intramembrane serine protease [Planctomycetota bacterium]REJ92965.1 MAG: rhomboid family intramembrane serine protease [Planctomycetota bacterium]
MLLPLFDNNPTRRWPVVTILLILINAAIHFFVAQMSDQEVRTFYAHWGFVPQRIDQLSDPDLVVKVPVQSEEEPVDEERAEEAENQPEQVVELKADSAAIIATLFTTMFLHGSWLHLLANMWMLWIFGNNIEDRLGHLIYILFYALCGLLATACHGFVDAHSPVPVVGASGAIAGILGGYAITYPTARVKTIVFLGFIFFLADIPAMIVLGLWFVMEFVQLHAQLLDPQVGGIAFAAHVGGFVAGLLLMPLFAMGTPDPGAHWEDEIEEAFGGSRPITR